MALTQKRKDELYDALVERSRQRLQRAMEPRSAASRMYPKLKSELSDNQPKQGLFQGWSYLSRQQKEK
jgi:hypothetical protein